MKNIFISWSRPKSLAIAKSLYHWLPNVVQAAHPWISEEDIEPGTRWQTVLAESLDTYDVGILCVTQENLDSQWLLFEAGALSKSITASCVIPYLIDLSPQNLPSPLDQFNAVSADEVGTKRLVHHVNRILEKQGRRVSKKQIETAFERFWPDLRREFRNLSIKLPGSEATVHRAETTSAESATVSELLGGLDFDTVTRIDVCAHTGHTLVEGLIESLKKVCDASDVARLKAIRIRVLLRSPRHETDDRASSIVQTLKRLDRYSRFFAIEWHFYSHLPVFRFVACYSQQPVDTPCEVLPDEESTTDSQSPPTSFDALYGWYYYPSPRPEPSEASF